jgi:acyl carrier protein
MHDIEERLSTILVRNFGVDREKISTLPIFDPIWLPTALLDLTLCVEDTFGIEICDEAAWTLHTVGDLIAFLRR